MGEANPPINRTLLKKFEKQKEAKRSCGDGG